MEDPSESIKNIIFIVGESKNRDGSEEDVESIHRTFVKRYNAEIYNWMDRTKSDYKSLFSDLKKNHNWIAKFARCKFVAVFCLFHGDTDGHFCINNTVISLKCFFLNPLFYIKELDGKLKWLIVQACRGSLKVPDFQPDGEAINKYLDYYMISYCTGEGLQSYQWGRGGKIFIQYLCAQLNENAEHKYDESLVSIIENVNAKVQEYGVKERFNNFPKPEYFHNFDYEHKFSH